MFSFRRASFPPTILANKPAIAVESALSCSYGRSRPCVNLRTKLTNILFGEYRLTQNDVTMRKSYLRTFLFVRKFGEYGPCIPLLFVTTLGNVVRAHLYVTESVGARVPEFVLFGPFVPTVKDHDLLSPLVGR